MSADATRSRGAASGSRWAGSVTLLAGSLLTAGLVVALSRTGERLLPAALLAAGALLATALLLWRLGRLVRRRARLQGARFWAMLVVLVVSAGLVASLVGVGPATSLDLSWLPSLLLRLLPVGVTVAGAAAGLILLSDAARRGADAGQRSIRPWELLTGSGAGAGRRTPTSRRGIAGAALVLAAAVFGILLTGTYLSGHLLPTLLVAAAIALTALAAILAPVAIAAVSAADRARMQRSRDQERERVAAHLHDSVLQTLALVRRQTHDPAMVDRLAREQEHQLRAWMAGGSTFGAASLAAALRDAIAETHGDDPRSVRLTITGDRPLDATSEAIASAAREALRNAARHAPGAAVFVFAQIAPDEIAVFVRDDGPGFHLDDVPVERRGVRDSIVRRMQHAGGSATIETGPGKGTEVTLRVRPAQRP